MLFRPGLDVPDSELEFTFVRSSGPGGQNVNKVNSKAVLRWDLLNSVAVSEEVKKRFLEYYSTRINQDGELVLTCDADRDQAQNKAGCLEKLQTMLARAATPVKKRKKTKPSRSSELKRRESKKRNSDKKKARSSRF